MIKRRKKRLQAKKDQNNNMEQEYDGPGSKIDAEEKQLAKVYRLTGEAKIKGVIEFIDQLVENEIKFILYAHHRTVLDAL